MECKSWRSIVGTADCSDLSLQQTHLDERPFFGGSFLIGGICFICTRFHALRLRKRREKLLTGAGQYEPGSVTSMPSVGLLYPTRVSLVSRLLNRVGQRFQQFFTVPASVAGPTCHSEAVSRIHVNPALSPVFRDLQEPAIEADQPSTHISNADLLSAGSGSSLWRSPSLLNIFCLESKLISQGALHSVRTTADAWDAPARESQRSPLPAHQGELGRCKSWRWYRYRYWLGCSSNPFNGPSRLRTSLCRRKHRKLSDEGHCNLNIYIGGSEANNSESLSNDKFLHSLESATFCRSALRFCRPALISNAHYLAPSDFDLFRPTPFSVHLPPGAPLIGLAFKSSMLTIDQSPRASPSLGKATKLRTPCYALSSSPRHGSGTPAPLESADSGETIEKSVLGGVALRSADDVSPQVGVSFEDAAAMVTQKDDTFVYAAEGLFTPSLRKNHEWRAGQLDSLISRSMSEELMMPHAGAQTMNCLMHELPSTDSRCRMWSSLASRHSHSSLCHDYLGPACI